MRHSRPTGTCRTHTNRLHRAHVTLAALAVQLQERQQHRQQADGAAGAAGPMAATGMDDVPRQVAQAPAQQRRRRAQPTGEQPQQRSQLHGPAEILLELVPNQQHDSQAAWPPNRQQRGSQPGQPANHQQHRRQDVQPADDQQHSNQGTGQPAGSQQPNQGTSQSDTCRQPDSRAPRGAHPPRRSTSPSNTNTPSRTTRPRTEFSAISRQHRELCSLINYSVDFDSLLALITRHGHAFNHACVTTCFLRLAKLTQLSRSQHSGTSSLHSRGSRGPAASAAASQATTRHQGHATTLNNLGNDRAAEEDDGDAATPALGPSVQAGGGPVLSASQQVLAALQPLVAVSVVEGDLRCLANILWVCAKLKSNAQLWSWLREASDQVTEQLFLRGSSAGDGTGPAPPQGQGTAELQIEDPRTASNLIYSLALLGATTPQHHSVMAWLAEGFIPMAPQANAQDLCNSAYALALHGAPPGPLWACICRTTAEQLSSTRSADMFVGQGLANLAWALGKLGPGCPEITPALTRHLTRTPAQRQLINAREAANVMWAAACLGVNDRGGWYQERAERLVPLLRNMDMQLLSMTLWAYATAEVKAPALLDAALAVLGSRPAWHLQRKPLELVNILWSLAKLERCDTQLFLALQPVARNCVDLMSPLEQQMLMWALGKFVDCLGATEMVRYLGLVDQQLVSLLLERLTPHIHAMSAHEVGTLAASLTLLTWYDEDINLAMTQRILELEDQLTLPQLSTMLWYMSKIVVVDAPTTTTTTSRTTNRATSSSSSGKGAGSTSSTSSGRGQHVDELPRKLMHVLRRLVAQSPLKGGDQSKEVARGLWCCALLAPEDTQTIKQLLQALSTTSDEDLDMVRMSMVAQALHATCQLGSASEEELAWLQEEPVKTLVARAVSRYQGVACEAAPSATQLQVYAELEHVPGVEARQLEVAAADGMFRIDILVRYRGVDVGVEVDGPFHYMINRQGVVMGDTRFRNRLLASHGYRMLSLRATEYTNMGTIQRRTQLLGELLSLALEAPEQLAERDRKVGDSFRPPEPRPFRTGHTTRTGEPMGPRPYVPAGSGRGGGSGGGGGGGVAVGDSADLSTRHAVRSSDVSGSGRGGGSAGQGQAGHGVGPAVPPWRQSARRRDNDEWPVAGSAGPGQGEGAVLGRDVGPGGGGGAGRDAGAARGGQAEPGVIAVQQGAGATGHSKEQGGSSGGQGGSSGGLGGQDAGGDAWAGRVSSGPDAAAVHEALRAASFAGSPAWQRTKRLQQASKAWQKKRASKAAASTTAPAGEQQALAGEATEP